MRIPLLSFLTVSPFEDVKEHAEKVKECAWVFQQAIECHIMESCVSFQELRDKVIEIEDEAERIKRRIRNSLPLGTFLPVHKFQLFRYLREQDHVLDSLMDALNWISCREEAGISDKVRKEFLLLIDAMISPVEELTRLADAARHYFDRRTDERRKTINEIIGNIHRQENEVDRAEYIVKRKVFISDCDAVTVFHLVRLAETLGHVADHAENAADTMQAMVAC